jgi:pimeloyl-ACP methyl ester carboxylesterase
VRVDEQTIELASAPVHYRTAPAGAVTPIYLHGVPASSEEWTPLLERAGGVAPDLLGFGRSAKGGHLEYTVPALAAFVERLIDHLGLQRFALVGRQWGAVIALELATRTKPERLALIDPLALTVGHQWGRLEKALRTPLVGELVMGATTKRLLGRVLPASASLDSAWRDFDQGTQRAILRLYRATEPDYLSRLGPLEIDALIVGEHTVPETLLPQAHGGDLIEFLTR